MVLGSSIPRQLVQCAGNAPLDELISCSGGPYDRAGCYGLYLGISNVQQGKNQWKSYLIRMLPKVCHVLMDHTTEQGVAAYNSASVPFSKEGISGRVT